MGKNTQIKDARRIQRQPTALPGHWKTYRVKVIERDAFRCRKCGKPGTPSTLEVDHIKPRFKGGCNEMWNLQTLCHDCHSRKTANESPRARDWSEWQGFADLAKERMNQPDNTE